MPIVTEFVSVKRDNARYNFRMTMPNSAPSKAAIVSLREITKDSVRDFCRMAVGPGQDGLVAPNSVSIAQAYFHKEAWFRGLYADDTPVGFAMMEDWSQVEGVERKLYEGKAYVSLWRFMIDARYQKLGFGAQAMRLLIAHAGSRPHAANMLLSFVPKANNPEDFYKRFGFIQTGEEDEGERIMRLPLKS